MKRPCDWDAPDGITLSLEQVGEGPDCHFVEHARRRCAECGRVERRELHIPNGGRAESDWDPARWSQWTAA